MKLPDNVKDVIAGMDPELLSRFEDLVARTPEPPTDNVIQLPLKEIFMVLVAAAMCVGKKPYDIRAESVAAKAKELAFHLFEP